MARSSGMAVVLALFEYVVLVLSISLHDMAQAWTANRLGDPTARMLGRLTLNPAKHFDMWGMIVWPAICLVKAWPAVGWGSPIPISGGNFRKPRRDEIVALAAGPAVHMLAAIVCMLLLVVLKHTVAGMGGSLQMAELMARYHAEVPTDGLPQIFPVVLVLYFGILVNLLLFVFQLMPLPLLDGGRVLRNFLPYNAQKTFDEVGFYLMMGFLVVGFILMQIFFEPLMYVFNELLTVL